MASFEHHIEQCKKNIAFYNYVNSQSDHLDWKVTVLFYCAVHLVNAHLDKKCALHYQSHDEVKNALNPDNILSLAKITDDAFFDYRKLQNLSRKSRYLVDVESGKNNNSNASFIAEKDLIKAKKHYNLLVKYFKELYSLDLGEV